MHALIACYLIWCFVMVPWCIGLALRIEGVRKHIWYLGDTAWYGLAGSVGVFGIDALGLFQATWWDVLSPLVFACVFMFMCFGMVRVDQAAKQKPIEDEFGMAIGCIVLFGSLAAAVVVWLDITGLSNAEPIAWRMLWPLIGLPFLFGTAEIVSLLVVGTTCLFSLDGTPGMPSKAEPPRKEPQRTMRCPATGWSENFR